MATEDGVTEQCPSMKIQHLIQEQQCDVELSQLTKEVVSEQQIPKHAHVLLLDTVWSFDVKMETTRCSCI